VTRSSQSATNRRPRLRECLAGRGEAKLSGLPERTFIRRFSKATGPSPLDYVHSVRLEEAKQMLETEDQPAEAIALEVGYEDAGFFNRLFRRNVGLTPAQYRRRFGSIKRSLPPLSPSPSVRQR
jgi:transcriptional regulator GlxA family with amidase domain